MILDLEIGPKSSRKSSFSKSFEEVGFEGYGPHRTGSSVAGNRRFATVYMVTRKIRSAIYVDSLLVALILNVGFFRARFFRRGWIVLVLGRFGPPI